MDNLPEPPVVAATIPFVGHLLGLVREKFNYLVQLSHQYSLPIFTLNVLGQKMYVITNADLMQATQKQPKTLSFLPIEAKAASNICGVSQGSEHAVYHDIHGEEGETAISKQTHAARRIALSPGPEFDKINQQMIQNLETSLHAIRPVEGQSTNIGLSMWLRRNVTAATTNCMYGVQNPFRDESVLDAVWQINKNLTPLMFGVLTSITASKGLSSRTVLAKAFEQYYQNEGHKTGSASVQQRYAIATQHGIALDDIAKFEVGEAIAMSTNTSPACFWALYFIYSTAGLLDEIRKNIDKMFDQKDDQSTLLNYTDIESLKQHCPLLVSTIWETLRYCSLGGSVRQVMENTVLDNRWLLTKGSIIQMPSRILHKDPSSWGDDVNEFNPGRFLGDLDSQKSRRSGGKLPNSTAFRPFGGGTTLCPGRHFATNTILVVAAMFVLHYDLLPVEGTWSMPSTNNTTMSEFMMEPDKDVEVQVLPRKGSETRPLACCSKA